MYFLFHGIDYYAAQLARQQQQEREHAAQIEAARRQQAAQRAQEQQQETQIIQVQQTAQPVGIRVCLYSFLDYFIEKSLLFLGFDGQIYWPDEDSNL